MRAQSTMDFAVGISLFIVAVASVFILIPGVGGSMAATDPETTPLANRVVSQLVGSTIGTAGPDPRLGLPCTLEFFRATPTGSPSCRFDQSVAVPDQKDPALLDRLGLHTRQRVGVRLRGDPDGDGSRTVLCWDGDAAQVVAPGDPGCDPGTASDRRLDITTGPRPDGSRSIAVSERVVTLAGTDATLEVHAW